jgi:hypothetical protein
VQPHLGQHFFDLVERLAAKVRGAEQLLFRFLNEITDVSYVIRGDLIAAFRRSRRSACNVHQLYNFALEISIRLALPGIDSIRRMSVKERKDPIEPRADGLA